MPLKREKENIELTKTHIDNGDRNSSGRHSCYTITLYKRLPIVLRVPLEASVTLLEATTPVKLPTMQCPPNPGVSAQISKGPYFNSDSMNTGVPTSKSPAYPTHYLPKRNAKLQ